MEISQLLSTPIPLRPSPPFLNSTLHKLISLTFFLFNIILIHSFQFLTLLLLIIPIPYLNLLQINLIRYSKETFTSLLIFLIVLFGKSNFVLSSNNVDSLENFLVRNDMDEVIGFKFDDMSVFISNHQQYGDWLYIWILLHFGNISGALVIVLKASLRWLPIVGPAMQWFKFAFIDKKNLLQNSGIVKNAQDNLKRGTAFALLLFPEATLVSRFTRPKSLAFAKASGIDDLSNLLLPRSTGLLWSLRSLYTVTPKLSLYNLTIGYPYVPNLGYAQDYYTLTSTFGLGQAPPKIYIHLESIPIEIVPLGIIKPGSSARDLELSLLESERELFQNWILEKWREKDQLMEDFYKNGEFFDTSNEGKGGEKKVERGGRIEFDIKIRREDYFRLISIPLVLFVVGVGFQLLYNQIVL